MPIKKSVLIVDDDESMLEYCATVLDIDGYHVTAVANGSEAVQRVKTQPFDLVLTDHVVFDGRSMLEVVKSLRPEADVIVMSGMPSLENAVISYLAGAAHYLSKPFKLDELRDAVRECLAKTR